MTQPARQNPRSRVAFPLSTKTLKRLKRKERDNYRSVSLSYSGFCVTRGVRVVSVASARWRICTSGVDFRFCHFRFTLCSFPVPLGLPVSYRKRQTLEAESNTCHAPRRYVRGMNVSSRHVTSRVFPHRVFEGNDASRALPPSS